MTDLHARGTQQGAGALDGARGEEHAVARLGTHGLGEPGLLLIGDVLGHGAGDLAVLLEQHVGETLGPALLGPFLPRVELAAGLGRAARHDHGTHVRGLEDPERGVLEVLGEVGELEVEAQVRLVGTVVRHGLRVGHARDGGRDVHADQRPQGLHDLLTQGDDVVLLHEGRLDIQLGELGLTVRAEVLVPVAPGDLEVLLDPAHLKQLLEKLRGLGQGVPRARGQARGDQEVASALGRGTGKGGGLHLGEAVVVQQVARDPVDLGTQAHDARGLGTAQVQVAVLQASFLAHLHVLVDLERQRRGRVEHGELVHHDLDLTRGQVGVLVTLRTPLHGARHLQDVLVAQLMELVLVPHHDLRHTGGVPQVHERHAAVVAAPADPARQRDGLSNVLGGQRAEFMRSQQVHSPFQSMGWSGSRAGGARRAGCLRSRAGSGAPEQGVLPSPRVYKPTPRAHGRRTRARLS